MILVADEVARSLAGAWELLQRRREGLGHFDTTAEGVRRSFAAFVLLIPAYICLPAAQRMQDGMLDEGSGLFDVADTTAIVGWRLLVSCLTLPLIVMMLATVLSLGSRLRRGLVACNWSNILGLTFLSVPALLFARGFATPELATFFSCAFLLTVTHLRWFAVKTALGVSGGVALLAVILDFASEFLACQLV